MGCHVIFKIVCIGLPFFTHKIYKPNSQYKNEMNFFCFSHIDAVLHFTWLFSIIIIYVSSFSSFFSRLPFAAIILRIDKLLIHYILTSCWSFRLHCGPMLPCVCYTEFPIAFYFFTLSGNIQSTCVVSIVFHAFALMYYLSV